VILVCGPEPFIDQHSAEGDYRVHLYGQNSPQNHAAAGAAIMRTLARRRLAPSVSAWDFLSLALSVLIADAAVRRASSPDGWTRDLHLRVAVSDPELWSEQSEAIQEALRFLTTDIWRVEFMSGATYPQLDKEAAIKVDAVALVSGGLDSLIGAIDLQQSGTRSLAVSQLVRGGASEQRRFASLFSSGSLQFNHNLTIQRRSRETSQRSRSLLFLAYAVLAITTIERYRDGDSGNVHMSENGFLALNPPLTQARVGSLSTRTAHPEFLGRIRGVMEWVGLRIGITNTYLGMTKGEMMRACLDQDALRREAGNSTSCGRFQRFNYRQCGRCIPCQIRRAAFLAAGLEDKSDYVYENLGRQDEDHARFDDVRSVAIAISLAEADADRWLGTSLSSPWIFDRAAHRDMLLRGLEELKRLHNYFSII
jgi:hypothetical protein